MNNGYCDGEVANVLYLYLYRNSMCFSHYISTDAICLISFSKHELQNVVDDLRSENENLQVGPSNILLNSVSDNNKLVLWPFSRKTRLKVPVPEMSSLAALTAHDIRHGLPLIVREGSGKQGIFWLGKIVFHFPGNLEGDYLAQFPFLQLSFRWTKLGLPPCVLSVGDRGELPVQFVQRSFLCFVQCIFQWQKFAEEIWEFVLPWKWLSSAQCHHHDHWLTEYMTKQQDHICHDVLLCCNERNELNFT